MFRSLDLFGWIGFCFIWDGSMVRSTHARLTYPYPFSGLDYASTIDHALIQGFFGADKVLKHSAFSCNTILHRRRVKYWNNAFSPISSSESSMFFSHFFPMWSMSLQLYTDFMKCLGIVCKLLKTHPCSFTNSWEKDTSKGSFHPWLQAPAGTVAIVAIVVTVDRWDLHGVHDLENSAEHKITANQLCFFWTCCSLYFCWKVGCGHRYSI